ncbi:hypothetical protein TNCV_2439361 [Trichonephila clavipes]|nr:hypothetical protein TNCV_2439361 [Trichonephila clavipes]
MSSEQQGMSKKNGATNTVRIPENVERVPVSIRPLSDNDPTILLTRSPRKKFLQCVVETRRGHSPDQGFHGYLKSSLPLMTDLPARGT